MINAIRVDGLGKKYKITHETIKGYKTLRESIMATAAAPVRWMKGIDRASQEEFWALKGVSFEIQPGQVVGIIGRNGAGKSTLLKVLSRITRPSEGRVALNGRVGSLLEVGTGFHPELTGRENVYLNGSILGMTRREIDRKFDEIVAFSEVEKFLDTPVKRYSSGMYVRLAFAVAAHLDPEILIVDEVLAVGDAGFQRKCLDKLKECAAAHRTVLLVSHQMNSVRDLCDTAIWLHEGSVKAIGSPREVIDRYLEESMANTSPGAWVDLSNVSRIGDGLVRFKAVTFHGESVGAAPVPDGPLHLHVRLETSETRVSNLRIEFQIVDRYQSRLLCANTFEHLRSLELGQGISELRFAVDSLHLEPGSYSLNLFAGNGLDGHDEITLAARLEVMARPGLENAVHRSIVTREFSYSLQGL